MSTLKSVCVAAVVVVGCLGVVHASNEALTSDIVVENGRDRMSLSSGGGKRATGVIREQERADPGLNASIPNFVLEKDPTLPAEGMSGGRERQGGCGIFEWYSSKYDSCYDIYGTCGQYDGTDSSTCRNGNDNLVCAWDSSNGLCTPVCYPEAQWYSSKYEKCFDVYGLCSQYDDTDASTCTTGKDGISCSWDPSSKRCD
jgi:hypothetical protein